MKTASFAIQFTITFNIYFKKAMTYFKFFLQVFINFAKLQTDMLDEEIDEIYPASGEHFIIIIIIVVVGVIFLGPMFHLHRGRE